MRFLFALALLGAAAHATPGDLLPAQGPYGTVAVAFDATIPAASDVTAATYLRADGRALGALLAARPEPGFSLDAAFAALTGASAHATRPVLLHGQPFELHTFAGADGRAVYALAFAVTPGGGQTVITAEDGALRLMAWSDAEDGALALAEAALDHLAASTALAFEDASAAPPTFTVAPNPFTDAATLRVTLAVGADVTASVFDVLGRRVAAFAPERLEAGTHTLPFAAGRLSSGAYIVRVAAGRAVATARVTRR